MAGKALEEATGVFEEAVEQLKQTERPSEPLALALHNLSGAWFLRLDRKKALVEAKEAWLEIDRAGPDTPQALTILHGLARLRILDGDFSRARAALRHAMTIYDSNRAHYSATEEGHAGTFGTFRAQTELMLIVAVDEQFPDEALEWIEAAKARFWNERLSKREALQTVESGPPAERGAFIWPSLAGGLPNALLLNYFVGPNFSFVVRAFNGLLSATRLDVTAAELNEMVDRFTLDLRSGSRQPKWLESGRDLSALLLAQLDIDSRTTQIIVVPDGPLWRLPFDALPVPDADTGEAGTEPAPPTLLGDTAIISQAPSAEALRRLRRGQNNVAVDLERVLVVSRSTFATQRPIPCANAEAADVAARAWPRPVSRLDGPRATPTAVKEALGDAAIVHVATHAVIGTADAPSAVVLSDGADGDAQLVETAIADLNLRARLIFLSACGSSLGEVSEGEGMVSLARAFIFAGAQCVIASLWPVNDRLTAAFVACYYVQLFAGASPSAALQRAKVQARRAGQPMSSTAAFHLIGDGGEEASVYSLFSPEVEAGHEA